MDKPITLSVKDWIIRNLSVKTNTSERIIEAVVNHQMTSAYKAMNTCYSLEFSGWGKFYFNKKKAVKKMERMLGMKEGLEKALANEATTAVKRNSSELKLVTLLRDIEMLKPRISDDKI